MNNTLWHTVAMTDVVQQLQGNVTTGLSTAEVQNRLAQYGLNRLRERKRESLLESLFESLREPLVLLLIFTGILYIIFGELSDAITIFFVIFVLAGIEVFNERRAERAIDSLRELAEPMASVLRDGQVVEVATEQVVPGDVIVVQAGRRVPTDARLLEGFGISVDESALTGEAVPTEKVADVQLLESVPLAERHNMLYAGTVITRGRGRAMVVGTGATTELGRIATLARETKPTRTPLQRAMSDLSRYLVLVALGVSVLVAVLGWLRGQPLQQMVLTGLSLIFATVPEEMPIIITMVLALGGYRLSKQHAIVKRLDAVETLGSVTVIATDKTGTLTENQMQVTRTIPASDDPSHQLPQHLAEIAVVCNDATVADGAFAGDPLETALLRAAGSKEEVAAIRSRYPIQQEFTFDNTRKRMSVVCRRDQQWWVAVKGSPEGVLACCDYGSDAQGQPVLNETQRQAVLAQAETMAQDGLRVIALAEKVLPIPKDQVAVGALTLEQAESHLVFVGLVGLADPLRPEAKQAIADCRRAGIRTLMVTGDHPITATVIGREAGLDMSRDPVVLTGAQLDAFSDEQLQAAVGRTSIYARTTPEHKLRIVQALRARGELIVATGDGINDAPALAAADIGVAMGETGTDVAREAASIVLADDNFATITRAIHEGRVLFANLRKAVRYYLSCKVALVLTTLLPVLLGVPVPFAPIQIILMELFMDLAASGTFISEAGEADLMQRPPRNPRLAFMDREIVGSIFSSGIGLFIAVSAAYLVTWYSGAGVVVSQTVAFATWLIGHVLLAFNLRSEREPLLRLGLFSNRLMIVWAVAAMVFLLVIQTVPFVQHLAKTTSLSAQQWVLVIGTAFVGTFWIEVRKWIVALQKQRI